MDDVLYDYPLLVKMTILLAKLTDQVSIFDDVLYDYPKLVEQTNLV